MWGTIQTAVGAAGAIQYEATDALRREQQQQQQQEAQALWGAVRKAVAVAGAIESEAGSALERAKEAKARAIWGTINDAVHVGASIQQLASDALQQLSRNRGAFAAAARLEADVAAPLDVARLEAGERRRPGLHRPLELVRQPDQRHALQPGEREAGVQASVHLAPSRLLPWALLCGALWVGRDQAREALSNRPSLLNRVVHRGRDDPWIFRGHRATGCKTPKPALRAGGSL